MPVSLAVGDIIEARYVCNITEQISVNRRHFRVEALNGEGATDAVVAQLLAAVLQTAYTTLMPGDAQFRGVSVQRVSPLPKPIPQADITNTLAGQAIGALQPAQICGVITLRTDLAGRAERGRAYLPFPSDTFVTGTAKVSQAYQDSVMANFPVVWAAPFSVGSPDGVDLQPVLWKPPAGPAKPITSALVRPEWGTQRRRGGFGAKNTLPF